MKDEFLKMPKGLRKIPTLTPTDREILSTFMEAWRVHHYKPFAYRLEVMASELNVPMRTICRSKSVLLDMGFISQSYAKGKGKVCMYSINENVISDTVDEYTIKSIIESYGDIVFNPKYDARELLNRCAEECGRKADDEFKELINKVFKNIKNGNKDDQKI